MGGSKKWTAAGAARAGREARIATAEHLDGAPIARLWQAGKLMYGYELALGQVDGHESIAQAMLLGGMALAPPYPRDWHDAAGLVLADEVEALRTAQLYVMSPQMCDVVLAAAQTLTFDDLELVDEDDLPSPTGMVVLPHPVLIETIGGNLSDERAYTWRAPSRIVRPTPRGTEDVPAVRISAYNDVNGPVQPDSFRDMAARAAAEGTPLPPLLLDAVRCQPFRFASSPDQRAAFQDYIDRAARLGEVAQEQAAAVGWDENRVVGEYSPGQVIKDVDNRFTERFLYAFWRLCEQRIAEVRDPGVNHSARVRAERAGVSPEVRVVDIRAAARPAGESPPTGRDWQHRWVVRMHKVRQWYPSEQRHRVLYRGPYVKGPADKPLLAGEVVRGLR
ncbi:hypothetical protein I4I73_04885 [Pseudonocardia sp. KRD-184]|uniref:Uncharacterized protein n=3 Tax=Pseudonocardia oceani TaxID=2792013 RepID=A0ABS6UK17_9PSEU|nr:hypothetical protein [Pseudonocardia oceani]MBW0095334.1 hypothetical protein [Pseudonocardia oceani]MBW0120056.1 hypothetical protein [Pseudonocardia oceani]MBW0132512.1 hypothetical protein [Pseudonocardia oceani]